MPIIPFIGLSILIHILVILMFKISRKEPQASKNSHEMYHQSWSSWLVISTVMVFVMANAFLVIRASVVDRHSSIHKIFSYEQNHMRQHQDNNLLK